MIERGGVWLPDGEQHLVEWMAKRNQRVRGVLTYQYSKLERALSLTHGRDCAIDVGAHCGLWSMHLGHEFGAVHAFEPVKDHVDCLMRNCSGLMNIHIHEHALGEKPGYVAMHTDATSSGDTYPLPGGEGNIRVMAYDDLAIGCKPNLVKLDCEGYELFALRGMRKMLESCKPVVVVEQKPGKATKYGLNDTDAIPFLESLGANVVAVQSGDYFCAW